VDLDVVAGVSCDKMGRLALHNTPLVITACPEREKAAGLPAGQLPGFSVQATTREGMDSAINSLG